MLQKQVVPDMHFPERLASLRKEKNLTQKELAELPSVHVAQIRRYESGTSQPTLTVIRKIAIALHVSADKLIFDEEERGPDDDAGYTSKPSQNSPRKKSKPSKSCWKTCG